MLTVNLEKELIKQNKKILLPEELLLIKEYERLGDDVCNDEILRRIGLNETAVKGRLKKEEIEAINKLLAPFDKERVFHISQIKSLCKKYHLRFLDTSYFKGSVDKHLSSKISTFEVAHDIRLNYRSCKIAAPANSFKLEERPKDPLLFFNLGNDYWYLIHKWGNDLSFVRRFYGILSDAFITFLSLISVPLYLFFHTVTLTKTNSGNIIGGTPITAISAIMICVIILLYFFSEGDIRFVKKNNWDSSYI